MLGANGQGQFSGFALTVALALSACGVNELGRWSAQSVGDLQHGPGPRGDYRAELTAACGGGGVTRDGLTAIERRPYLQRVTSDNATIVWTGQQTARVRLIDAAGTQVATTTAMVDRSARPRTGKQFLARLGNLRPDSIYCYEIAAGDDILVLPTGFRTAPAADTQRAVRFVAMGDVGSRSIDQDAVKRQLRDVPFEMAVIAGDVAYGSGSPSDLDHNFFAPFDQLLAHVPFFVAAGNHDYRTRSGAPLREAFVLPDNGGPLGAERWYSFEWGPVHFSVLDTEVTGPDQATWLARDLDSNTLPWSIVIMHRPAWSGAKRGGDEAVREHFVPVFEHYGVDLVFAGHEHHYERLVPINGVTYIITGGGGRGTRPVERSARTAFSEQVAHFVHVTAAQRSLTVRAIDASGATFDTLRFER